MNDPTFQLMMSISVGMLFLGMIGMLFRRNIMIMIMCVELMLNAANLAMVAAGQHWGNRDGQIMVFFVMVLAATEAVVGLSLVIAWHRKKGSLDIASACQLKG